MNADDWNKIQKESQGGGRSGRQADLDANASMKPLNDALDRAMNSELKTLAEEKSRDEWLARDAAEQISNWVRMDCVPTELLEALSEMIRQELQDRDLRNPQPPIPEQPF